MFWASLDGHARTTLRGDTGELAHEAGAIRWRDVLEHVEAQDDAEGTVAEREALGAAADAGHRRRHRLGKLDVDVDANERDAVERAGETMGAAPDVEHARPSASTTWSMTAA